jgi:uncharacterized membrane protein YhaH (DUF805 family)
MTYDIAMNLAASPIIAPRSPYDDAMSPARILFSFRGRVPRKVYWLWGILGPLLFSMIAEMLLEIVGMPERRAETLTSALLLWPCAAVSVKRWHDLDRTGWWVLLHLVPLIGMIWTLIANGTRRGTVGANRFGLDLTGQF